MLPFFKSKEEVATFVKFVNKRSKTMLLLETPEAVENIDDILSIDGIDYIHIGLNDLHLGYGMTFMFELLADGTVEKLCNKIKTAGIPYGFGGVAQIGEGTLPAENIMAEHYRLGSSMVILSRSFLNTNKQTNYDYIENEFFAGIQKIRTHEIFLTNQSKDYFVTNREKVVKIVKRLAN